MPIAFAFSMQFRILFSFVLSVNFVLFRLISDNVQLQSSNKFCLLCNFGYSSVFKFRWILFLSGQFRALLHFGVSTNLFFFHVVSKIIQLWNCIFCICMQLRMRFNFGVLIDFAISDIVQLWGLKKYCQFLCNIKNQFGFEFQ